MRIWLRDDIDFPVIGAYFTEPWAAYLFSYGGLLLDLSIVPLLMWRRTRWAAVLILTGFHVLNAMLFNIGIFPWFMLAVTPLFFPPNWRWPDRIGNCLSKGAAVLPGAAGTRLARLAKIDEKPAMRAGDLPASSTLPSFAVGLIAIYVTFHILFPLRHVLYPGDPNWTEEGHFFSWHMKLRDKRGHARFTVYERKSDQVWIVDPREFLTPRQLRKMAGRPEMLRQFAHYIANRYRAVGLNVEVRVQAVISLNGRYPQLLLDPDIDLASQSRALTAATWIRPLERPLKGK